jgi:1-acyl-sn-glycerol-3-phosphate acyltransferase
MGKRAERDYSPGWRLVSEIILQPVIRGMMKRDTGGKEYFPDGGLIVAGNHLSYADWPAMALFCYQSGHYPVFTIKSPVFDVKILGSILRKLGQLPVYRGRADAALVLRDAEQRIARGACVIFYPEGTASRDPDQWPMVARTGVARLALSTGAPVIPVACWGAQVILPYGDKRPRLFPRKTVQITAGPPVDLSAFAGRPLTADTLRGATDAIMADITRLLAGLRGEQPPAVPYDPRAGRGAVPEKATPSAGTTGTGTAGTGAPSMDAGVAGTTGTETADTGTASTGTASTGTASTGTASTETTDTGTAGTGTAGTGTAGTETASTGTADTGAAGPDAAPKAQQG